MAAEALLFAVSAVAQDFNVTVFDGPEKPIINTAPSHRIPALAQASDGSLLAVCDYRYGLSDVGAGSKARIEMWLKRSTDMGRSWSEHQVICPSEVSTSGWKFAMGDGSLVADRESGDVLLMCAAGTVGNGASTAKKPIRIGCFRSSDNGTTWDEGTELTEQIYSLFQGDATAIFITSGRLCQSRLVKVGTHYRIYAAFPVRTASRGNSTGVMYSDDFGREWHLLGMDEAFPEGTVYEEGKVEEMPNGDVVLMVRDDRGAQGVNVPEKNFNVFHYTDVTSAQGQWSQAESAITGMANACNSGFIVVPACRTDDGSSCHLLLTTVPFHTVYARNATDNYGRCEVGFYYKEINSADDYASGAALAEGWTRGLQVTDKCSAYADLLLLSDRHVGLLLEDDGRQGRGADGNNETEAYDIVFYHLSLSTITEGRYELATDADPDDGSEHPVDGIALATASIPSARSFYDLQGRRQLSLPFRGVRVARGAKFLAR